MITPTSLPQPFIPISSPEASLETVGGKGLNLSKLARARFNVPDGFLIPTSCYRDFVEHNEISAKIQDSLQDLDPTSPEDLSAASYKIRTRFERGSLPPSLVNSLEIGWRWLGARPVAVRSSATAEDLPELSFAGQQDTFLNIVGEEALNEAVTNCWSSLWTARSIGYRSRNNIPHEEVALSVVVQNMVQSEASGVLFTANPLTGKHAEVVIDATLGLGEALVSGQVEPDHYVVDTQKVAITHKFLGRKSVIITGKSEGGVISQEANSSNLQAIPDEVILKLTKTGKEIEALYGYPQDIEWAWVSPSPPAPFPNGDGEIFILQSRPITSLFPLPDGIETEPLRFMIGFHTIQGIFEPLTPLGIDVLKLVLTGGGQLFKLEHTIESQTAFYTAAERLWINMTPILRTPIGHKAYPQAIRAIDPGVAEAIFKLVEDPRFAPIHSLPSIKTIRRAVGFIIPFITQVIRILRNPDQRRADISQAFDEIVAKTQARQKSTGVLWEDFARRVALVNEAKNLFADFVIPKGVPAVVAGIAPFFGILQRFSKEISKTTGDSCFETLYLEISRGMPNNVTTEMDLALWETAQKLRVDPTAVAIFETSSPQDLAADYIAGTLSHSSQDTVAAFLTRYGVRGPGEIDIGRERWREDPTHIMQILQSYLQIDNPQKAPDTVFRRGAEVAEAAVEKLIDASRKLPGGWIKSKLIRFAASRYRSLGGMREAPKFFAIRMMGIIRQGLLQSGRDFKKAELLTSPDDLFFLTVRELNQIAEDKEFPSETQGEVTKRRVLREREMLRKQIPRVLLSDGTAYYSGVSTPAGDDQAIVGDPVSPGIAEGIVRIVLDPHGTHLEPGEILVCPGTDPAWTPLFLAAGGLVMEVGGMMTHGSVVAREYGIPAVVGVNQATERLYTGQRVRVDGSTGYIEIL